MKDRARLIARLAPTTSGSIGHDSHPSGRLPDDMMSDQVRRLMLFAGIGGGLWAVGLLMDLVLLRIADTTFVPTPMVTAIEILGIATATS